MVSLESNSNDAQTALVDGIYITNQLIRKQTMSYIWAKYNMLPDNLTQSLGRVYNAIEEIYLPDKNQKSLFNYTHDKSSVYSRSIAEKNLTVKDGNVQRSVTEIPREAYNSWYGTAYQNRNYYNVFETSKNEDYSYRENYKTVYIDNNTTNITSFMSNKDDSYTIFDGYRVIPSENNFDELKNNIEKSEIKLKENKRPRKQDYYENGILNESKYNDAIDSWREKTNKEKRKNRKEAKKEKKYNENILNNEYIAEPVNILTKTSKLFKENKIHSLIGRFHGDKPISDVFYNEYVDTARSKYGNSHGRNLLKKEGNIINGYNNPYCRVWTYHHQYGTSKNKLIRPFYYDDGTVKDIEASQLIHYFRSDNGGEYLHDCSVLKNGFVKITPDNLGGDKYDTKKCMFSIENLAWKDVRISNELSKDQIGPNGGRIMWFPPYDLQYQETSQANWNETNFIGRGEPIYTYTNTKRTGTLSFTLLIDHPSIMNIFDKRAEDEKDINEDNDILSFFAGCNIPMKLNNENVNEGAETNTEPSDEYFVTGEDGFKIKFSIFFPNNYSGYFNNTDYIDNDWAKYLFWGSSLDSDPEQKKGYEMDASGITNINKYIECTNTNGEKCKFFYRFDKDLCQKLSESNTKDSGTFKLNLSGISNSNYENNIKNISFAELYTKLHYNETKVQEWAKNNNILDSNNKFLNSNVNELDKLERYKLKITGIATSQDEVNSSTLASRRAQVVKKFLEDKLNLLGGDCIETIVADNITETVNDDNINSENSKKGRRADVEIIYNLPEVEGIGVTTSMTYDERINLIISKTSNTPPPNEADYFNNLEKIDNFTYQKIKEKIKYFEPAYHSISPEGFNSRLTFLHQCTRQGHTLERNESSAENTYSTAGNLAFGRPPFCVLRIGDFINTKILIRNLNIVYQNGNGMQWDMNPEGIGVQPMFAKVTMQIEIIGGQSLDAPISKLNNAVSFNYYANTGVYDNRADRALYNNTGVTYSNLYEPQQ